MAPGVAGARVPKTHTALWREFQHSLDWQISRRHEPEGAESVGRPTTGILPKRPEIRAALQPERDSPRMQTAAALIGIQLELGGRGGTLARM